MNRRAHSGTGQTKIAGTSRVLGYSPGRIERTLELTFCSAGLRLDMVSLSVDCADGGLLSNSCRWWESGKSSWDMSRSLHRVGTKGLSQNWHTPRTKAETARVKRAPRNERRCNQGLKWGISFQDDGWPRGEVNPV